MKLDVNALRHLSRDDFRTLTAVEQGQKNVRRVWWGWGRRRDYDIFFPAFSTLERAGGGRQAAACAPQCLRRPPRPICSLATR